MNRPREEKAARGDKTEAAHKTTIGLHRSNVIPIGQRCAANCEWCGTHLGFASVARQLCPTCEAGAAHVGAVAAASTALNRLREANETDAETLSCRSRS